MPQERYNAQWVRENGVGIVHGSFRTIEHAVAQLLSGMDAFKARVRQMENRALFEVPEILDRILVQATEHVDRGIDTGLRHPASII